MGFAEAALCCCRRNASSPARHISSRRRVYLGQLSRAQQRRELHKNRGSLCPCGSLTSAPAPPVRRNSFKELTTLRHYCSTFHEAPRPAWTAKRATVLMDGDAMWGAGWVAVLSPSAEKLEQDHGRSLNDLFLGLEMCKYRVQTLYVGKQQRKKPPSRAWKINICVLRETHDTINLNKTTSS